jgi:putative heme-binding domain-containing protein
LQWAAAKSLGLRALPAELDSLVARYSECTVATRREIVLALLRRPAGAAALVEAVEAGGVPAAELDSSAREALSRSPDPALVPRVKELFASQTPADRQEVLERYQAVLTMPGDVRRGGAAFAARCLGCHRGAGRGQQVGPDLSGIAGRPKQALLEDILAPSRQIAGDQQCYTLVTAGGQVLVGLLAGETGEAVTLRRAEGLEDVVPRASISELRATGRSLMPDGFEEQIPPAEMADLLAFLAAPQAERALGLEAFPSGH